jgi:hypothetical protein
LSKELLLGLFLPLKFRCFFLVCSLVVLLAFSANDLVDVKHRNLRVLKKFQEFLGILLVRSDGVGVRGKVTCASELEVLRLPCGV